MILHMNLFSKVFNQWPFLLLIGLWTIAWVWISNPILVPSPAGSITALIEYFDDSRFLLSLNTTVWNLVSSWLIVQLLLLITLVIITNRHAETLIDNWSSMFQSVPTFALLPILIVLMGFSQSMLYTLVIFGNYWVASSYLITALHKTRLRWQPHARNLNWSVAKQLRHIYLPALVPFWINIASITWGLCWRTLLAIEVMFGGLSGQLGLGVLMMENRTTYDTEEVWGILLVILIIGLSMNAIVQLLKKKVFW
jgi:NitT/TauT family transport system permease protein